MRRFCVALLSVAVCLSGCQQGPSGEGADEETDGDGEPGDGDGDPGDGDGDGEPGDGDGDGEPGDGDGDGEPGDGDGDGEPGDGDGDPGDGDGDADCDPGDGDGEPGDGSEFEGWCEICVDPPDNGACGVVHVCSQQWVQLSTPQGEYQLDIDETCTVILASSVQIRLDCESYDPVITLELTDPWQPTLEAGETVRLHADGYAMDLWGWNMDWRIDRADDTLALAGLEDFGGFGSIGLGAVPVSWVTDACTPQCAGSVIYQEIGLAFEHEGEQGILFTGMHDTIGGLEIWVPKAERLACDMWGDGGYGYKNVFISAG